MPRFAANLTMMFTEWPFLDRFAAAADAGFEAVEFLFPYDHAPKDLAHRLERHRLTLALFNLPPGNWDKGDRGLAALPDRRGELRESFLQAQRYTQALGARRVHLMAGLAPSGDPAAQESFRGAIREAAAFFAPDGIDVLIEPINTRDVPGYFLRDFSVAAHFVETMGLSNLKLQFDIYHRQILHGDVIRGLRALMPLIAHIQVASVPERHEPNSGELDDARVFEELDRLGYTGFVGCEYRPRTGTLEGLGWLRKADRRSVSDRH